MKKIYIKRTDLFKNLEMVMCNNLINVDESFYEDNIDLFQTECEECKGEGCNECEGGYNNAEIYQYFLVNIDDYTKEKLESWGVDVGYSEKLDLSVIPIYDFGTGWEMFSYSKEVEDDYQLGYNETAERTTCY